MKKFTLIFTVMFITGISFGQMLNLNKKQKQLIPVQSEKALKPVKLSSHPHALSKGAKGLLNENFDLLTFPPASWSLSGAASSWYNSGNSAISQYEANGSPNGHFAYYDCFNLVAASTASLITPVLHPDATNHTLSYQVNYYLLNTSYIATGAQLFIEFSTNGGTTWTTSTTNVLAALSGYNVSTTGWITLTADLTTYESGTVQVRFRAISDYGGFGLGIDNVTGPNADITLPTYDIVSNSTFLDFDGFNYYEVIPFNQMGTISYVCSATNAGANPLTNVKLNVNINGGAITGASTPIASMASLVTDTIIAQPTITTPTTTTAYNANVYLTQTETDVNPANNASDSITFYANPTEFERTLNLTDTLSPYSFAGGGVPAATGMEYGANYYLPNADEIDSIEVLVYGATAGTNITGKLYTVNQTSGARTVVAQSASTSLASASLPSVMELPLTSHYTVAAGTILTATVSLTTNISSSQNITIGADGSFIGDASIGGVVYLNVSGTWQWSSITNTVPVVGLITKNHNVGIKEINNDQNISIYPIPANNELNINSSSTIGNVKLVNALGQIVFNSNINSSSYRLNTGNFEKGMYILQIENEKGITVKKVSICR